MTATLVHVRPARARPGPHPASRGLRGARLEAMNVGVLGTGPVGRGVATPAGRARPHGGDRQPGPGQPGAAAWLASVGTPAGPGWARFADAAAHGALLVNATSGDGSIAALKLAGERNLHGKVLLDLANPRTRRPPSCRWSNTDSLAEQIQRTFPDLQVVKALNMVDRRRDDPPGPAAGGDHHVRGRRRPGGQGDRGRPAPLVRLAVHSGPGRGRGGPGHGDVPSTVVRAGVGPGRPTAFNLRIVRA